MNVISHKRGDTLTLGLLWEEGGSAIDLTGYTVAAQIRTRTDVLIAALTVTVADQTTQRGRFTITATATATAAWPIGSFECDIQFTIAGVVTSSETFGFNVVKDITR